MIERGVTPHLSRPELRRAGLPADRLSARGLYAAREAITDVLTELRDEETTAGDVDRMLAFDEFNELVELDARYADEARYAS